MNIEEDIFKKTIIDFNKLELYGFKKNNNKYIYSKTFYNSFRADITIDKKSKVSGKVYDLETNEEYTNIRLNLPQGSFINNIKESYKEILLDIKNKCTTNKYFISDQANRITKYIYDKYNDKPCFLWEKYPDFAVFRNNNNKWYAIIMNIDKKKISNSDGKVDIINIKTNEEIINKYINKKGYYKAYHMNKKNWLTITLDDTIKDIEIFKFIDESYIKVRRD